jgi:putative transposase
MIRIHLDDTTRDELQTLRRADLSTRARDRLEMVCLAGAGWSAPRIAAHLGYCGHTVRGVLKDFLCRGTAALFPRRTGPPPDAARRHQVTEALRGLLSEDRTWTTRQLSQALGPRGVALSPRQVHRYLGLLEAGWGRTSGSLRHKQDPVEVARAKAVLHNLKAKARAGRIKLYYLDQCGFSPTLPTAYTWHLPGQRKRVKYEAPRGRRVNAMAAYRPYGRSPRLEVFTAERTWDSYDFLAFVRSLPWSKVPRVVVLDNASLHTSGVVKRARAGLAAAGIYLYFLPPYSPELNEAEPVFRQVKYQEIPVRSHTTRSGLRTAAETGFDTYRRSLLAKPERKHRRAA